MEAKVRFHIQKYLRDCEEKHIIATETNTIAYLNSTYREYQRKQQGPLRKLVAKILKKLQGNTSDTISIKRQRSGSDDDEEYERQALEYENAQSKERNGALNQSVRERYMIQNKANTNDTKSMNGVQSSTTIPPSSPKPIKKKIKRSRLDAGNNSNVIESRQQVSSTESFLVSRPTTRYSDFGGIQAILQEVKELIEYPLTHPEVYQHLGVAPPRGILLHGPPGTGKSMLANAIAGECGAAFLKVSAPEIVSGMSGESEQKLRQLFDDAIANAPSIIFIDEIDAITPKRETSQRGMEKRIVAQLLTSTDSLSLENTSGKPVVIIGATNRPDALDSALRRAGRFDREICVGIPDEEGRCKILQVLAQKMRLEGSFQFDLIAKKTPGFVGADLVSLTKEAAVIAVNRIFSMSALSYNNAAENSCDVNTQQDNTQENLDLKDHSTLDTENTQEPPEPKTDDTDGSSSSRAADALRARIKPFTDEQLAPLSVTMADFIKAIPKVQPSAKREGFATIPNVTWSQVGALTDVREELVLSILHPIRHPEMFASLGLTMPAGVLLYGPPGCGKTLLAKAIAHESGANFISIKGPELLDKYVGESERAVRQVFQRARASAPCVVFFDELDALAPRRGGSGGGGDSGNGVSERVVNQLLTELDGLEARRQVFVVAATNRPDIIDPAMLRPGRLDKLLYVPLPGALERKQILETLTRSCNISEDVDLEKIASDSRCEGFSGADLSALIREAGIAAIKTSDIMQFITEKEQDGLTIDTEQKNITLCIEQKHFIKAFETISPSVSKADQKAFEKLKKNLRKKRTMVERDTIKEDKTNNKNKIPINNEKGMELN